MNIGASSSVMPNEEYIDLARNYMHSSLSLSHSSSSSFHASQDNDNEESAPSLTSKGKRSTLNKRGEEKWDDLEIAFMRR